MRTALIYDRVNKWGGAERVLLALHELFPQAPLYTSVYDKENARWADVFDVRTSFLQNLPHVVSNHEYYPFFMPIAFEQFNFDNYDLVISVTSEAAKGIITKPHTRHICFCLTPTRYLWSGYDQYFKNKAFKYIVNPVVKYLRVWDKIASNRPDLYIAISKEVQKRIKKYYCRDSELVYPPLFLDTKMPKLKKKNYFLIVSRLVLYKNIDLAIKTFNHNGLPLKIIGIGKEEEKLKKIAGPTIEFLGKVSELELAEYYTQAKALICPGIEDFGLNMVEAQKYKTPVIAFRSGGALEIIKENKTGLFFDQIEIKSLNEKILDIDRRVFKDHDFKAQTRLFTFRYFKENFLSLVGKSL
jgi:glycosyltransferase involved in cell wall biosynthesis